MAAKGIRVEPPFLEFKDMKVGEVYKKAVSITNIGKISRKIFVEKPALKIFKLIRLGRLWFLPPGFCIRGTLEFTPVTEEEKIKDSIRICIDEQEILEVPVTGLPRLPSFIMDSWLDFGCLVASNQVVSKMHPIINIGSAPGRFQVKYERSESFSLQFFPSHGIIEAGTTLWLTVELCVDRPGLIAEEALVMLQDCSDVLFSIQAEVVEQHLEVSDVQGFPLPCLWFGPVYFGAFSEQKVLLRNNSPISCDWVCLLLDKTAGIEAETDLQKSTGTTLLERMKNCSSTRHSAFRVLECVPAHGRLSPYDTTTVAVRFSPKPRRGWRSTSPGRQDYCLFLLFDVVSCKHGFTLPTVDSSVEVAVTGSGIPVALVPSPSDTFDFSHCAMGQHSDLLCVLQNLCPQLPIRFRFRKLAHFTAHPRTGTIAPGQYQDVVLTFNARQQGTFHVRQKVDILGWVACQKDGSSNEVGCFHTILLHLSAICDSVKIPPQQKLHSALKCPAGLRPCVRLKELDHCSMLGRIATAKLHKHRRTMSPDTDIDEFLAFPNDRPASIKPVPPHTQYRTIFTGVPRHNYVDPTYAFTKEEEELRRRNQQIYMNFIKQLYQRRQQQTGNDDVLEIDTHNGLVPPEFSIRDLNSTKNSDMNPSYNLKHFSEITNSGDNQIFEAVNTVPSTRQQVADCRRTLNPLEFYQVDITPSSVNFGTVALNSVCTTNLHLVNRLPVHIWVELEVNCVELQGSSMLSQVLPPFFHSIVPLTFQSTVLGHFKSSLSYTINQQHPGQILILAEVVLLTLELSTNLLVLTPNPVLLAGSEYRGIVTLRNMSNCAAEFTWKPVIPESGLLLYSIRPSTGVVEPHMEMDCEINWHPGFNCPTEGDFDLFVQERTCQSLHCVAKVGSTTVELAEKRILFTSVPLNMTSVRSTVLHNSGQNHAYFEVVNLCPLPGMVVSPSLGVVPSRGQAMIRIQFNPDCVFKFDTKIEIAIKNTKSIKLRIGGSVETPNVTFSKLHFQFCGVHTGSQARISFSITNHSVALSQITFDLSKYKEFSVKGRSPPTKKEQGVAVVEVGSGQTEECFLVFSPTQVISYDFVLPVMVNGVKWPTSLPSFFTSSSSATLLLTPDSRKTMTTSTTLATDEQQSLLVEATALFAPVEMSSTRLQFVIVSHSPTFPQIVELKAQGEQSICWKAVEGEGIRWRFDLGAAAELCAVAPAFGFLRPGQSVCLAVTINPDATRNGERITKVSIPLYLGGQGEERKESNEEQHPYRKLSVIILLSRPSIVFYPRRILFTPVPLSKSTKTKLILHTTGYPCGTTISAECEEVETKDGTKIRPISVSFPDGNRIYVRNITEGTKVVSLLCEVSFCSAVPVSLCTAITFRDHMKNKFKIKVCAVAENCLLTIWPYLAIHHTSQHVVLQTGSTSVEAVLLNYNAPSPESGPITSSSSSSSSSFDQNTSTYLNTSDSLSYCQSMDEQASKDENHSAKSDTPGSLSIPKFPVTKSEETKFYQKVLLTVEKWFSLYGWPSGTNPMYIPHSFRRVVFVVHTSNSNGRAFSVTQNKDTRSVVDMLEHLTGRMIPGIPMCQTFSKDIQQRTIQVLQQNEAILEFLRVQGACLCHIKPEYLLDIAEFKHWCSLQEKDSEKYLDCSFFDFWSLSKRSWTDVLMQIYKVLVLSRVPEDTLHEPLCPRDTEDALLDGSHALTSTIYSLRELHLLSWLNMNYQKMRKIVWEADRVPSSRWIVNFDLDFSDGLVLGALIAAHCPYLIRSHFQRMYTTPCNVPQILHNNIVVTQALNLLGLSLNIKSTELCEINPVQTLFLCVHLYETLPHYMPTETLTLSGCLHSTFSKQVRLRNPSSKPLKYKVLLFGEDAHLFSVPGSSVVTVPAESDTEVTVQFRCCFLRPVEAVLLLITSSAFGLRCATLAFNLKTCVTQIMLTNLVYLTSPCYQLKVINMTLTNNFNEKACFRVILVESSLNPYGPENKKDLPSQQKLPNDSEKEKDSTSDTIGGDQFEDGEANEFLCKERSVYLEPGQPRNLQILYLPFFIGTKYCSVLLLSPQVGDMVYIVKATSEIPLPSPLPSRPTLTPGKSDTGQSFLSLQCEVGEVCEEVLKVPLVNKPLENALTVWAQHCIGANERKRRILTRSLRSCTMRADMATQKLLKCSVLDSIYCNEALRYKVEVSLPHCFDFPKTVTIPVKEGIDVPWDASTEYPNNGRYIDKYKSQRNPFSPFFILVCDCVDVPLRFQAHSVGELTCNVVLTSCFDTRVYQLKAFITQEENPTHLDFSSPALQSVIQHIPLLNETLQNWSVQAKVCGEGFSGPDFVDVPAGTKQIYPLTVLPTSQCIATGRLCLHNEFDGTEHVFTLRRMGAPPLPLDHMVLSCPVGKTTYAELDIPNYTQKTLTLRAVTDLPILSGSPSLEINPGQGSPYTLAVSPWKRGEYTGSISFVEHGDMDERENNKGNSIGNYIVIFSLVVNCKPEAPIKVIDVQCVAQSSVAIEIPVTNPGEELLTLDVCLEGGDLTGANQISLPPRGTLSYKVTYSPVSVGKGTGSVVFQSELMGEFWYQLELYALPPSVVTLPQAHCHLGKWVRINIPLVNPTAEMLKLIVANSNPRHYSLEMDSAETIMLAPKSCTHIGVRFSPSSNGEENHHGKVSFTCSQLQDCCVLLSGCGLRPEVEEPLCMSCLIGSSTSISVPILNPTDHQATLNITLTAEDLNNVSNCKPINDEKTFSCTLDHAEALQISERATVGVPVVFTPKTMELQKAWLRVTMKPISGQDSAGSSEELLDISWIYPLRGIPVEAPIESSPLAVLQCEVGGQLESTVDVQLTGYVPGNREQRGQQGLMEDFLCKVHSASETAPSSLCKCLSISIKEARRDPDSGIVMLTLHLIYTPRRTRRFSSVLAVQSSSGKIWEFPLILIAMKPQVDDVIHVEPTEIGRTSAVGFRLTSTTRSSASFKATFLPGSSSEFTVAPASGMLPPAGTAGALISVFFTPTASCKRHRARLAIQTVDMQWLYDVRGKTLQDPQLLRESSPKSSFPAPLPPRRRRRNFVVQNLRIPFLANSSPVKVKK